MRDHLIRGRDRVNPFDHRSPVRGAFALALPALLVGAACATSPAGAMRPDPGEQARNSPPSVAGVEDTWRDARWGMTQEQVLAAVPGQAFRLSPPVNLPDGNVVAVGIDGLAADGLGWQVRYLFEGGGLALVSLRTPPNKAAEADAYVRLRDALEKRWGPPLEETKDGAFIDMRQARWALGASRVDLKYIPGVVALVFYPAPPP